MKTSLFGRFISSLMLLGMMFAIASCGSDDNRVNGSDIDRDVLNPATFGNAQDVINQYINSTGCPSGGFRVTSYWHINHGGGFGFGQSSLQGYFNQGQAPSGGLSFTKAWLGKNQDWGDVIVVREFGSGSVAQFYEVELAMCTDQLITASTSFTGFAAIQIVLDHNLGQTVGSIDSAITNIDFVTGGLLPSGLYNYPFSADFGFGF